MPKRTDFQTVLIIGSGPIVIGQACELITAELRLVKLSKKKGTGWF